MNETMDEMPFGSDLVRIKHHHRDPIMRITFMPSVDPNTKSVDWSYGEQYLSVLFRDVVLGVMYVPYNSHFG